MRFKPTGLLLALIAVFAMSAVAASAASAAKPEFKPVPAKKKFTATGGGSTWTLYDGLVTCSNNTMSGEITAATTLGDVIVKFTGCTFKNEESEECPLKSPGAGSGEVVTDALTGELGTIVGGVENSNVAVLLTGADGVSRNWAVLESKCGTDGTLAGRLAGSVELEKRKGKTNDLYFGAFKEVEMDSGTVVKPGMSFIAGQVTMAWYDKLTFEEELEIT